MTCCSGITGSGSEATCGGGEEVTGRSRGEEVTRRCGCEVVTRRSSSEEVTRRRGGEVVTRRGDGVICSAIRSMRADDGKHHQAS